MRSKAVKRDIEQLRAANFWALKEWLDSVDQIEVYDWGPTGAGYLGCVGGRKVNDVANDLARVLEENKIPFEYVSTSGNEPNLNPGRKVMGDRWLRDAHTAVRLETGGNEGYSLYVTVTSVDATVYPNVTTVYEPIRVKTLTDWPGALVLHAFGMHLFGR